MPANPGGLIYGTIVVATLLAAESARSETYARTIGGVVVALVLYWLAHSYAAFTGERLERGEPFRYPALARTASHELAVLYGAALPLLVLLIFWATGNRLATGVTAAIWSAVAMIVAAEVTIGIRADLKGGELARQTSVGALLGVLVLALRLVLH